MILDGFWTDRLHICSQFTEIEYNRPNVFTACPERSIKKAGIVKNRGIVQAGI